MSIKIYDGYKIPQMSTVDLLNFCQRFRNDVNDILEIKFHEKIAREACRYVDRNQFDLHCLTKQEIESAIKYSDSYFTPVSLALTNLREDFFKDLNNRNISPDIFHCNISIHPLKDKILIMLFTSCRDYTELFKNFPEVKFYGYWNNVDPDENCTEEEWQQRKEDWDDGLNNFGVPKEEGFVFDPITYPPTYSAETIKDCDPGKEFRVKSIVRDIMYTEYFNQLYPDQEIVESLNLSDHSRAYHNFVDSIIDGDLKNEYDNNMTKFQNQIQDFSADLISEKYKISETLISKAEINVEQPA